MTVLTEKQLSERLQLVPEWRLENGTIWRDLTFPDFPAAVAFVNKVAAVAEAAGHHPDIDIRWNKVHLVLVSHDAGSLTERDFSVAAKIDEID